MTPPFDGTRFKGIRRLFRIGATPRSILQDVDEEMRFHLNMRIEDLMRLGHSRNDAESNALREFGDLSTARSELASIDRRAARHSSWREWLGSLGHDLRFAFRGFRTRPVFSLTILVTLALGVGANAAIFSVVDSMLLRPLPFAQPDRLVHLWERYETKVDTRSEASYPDYLDWRARNRVFSDLGGYTGGGFLLGAMQPSMLIGGRVTANFFDVLGVRAAVGRTFIAGEDAVGAPEVALLSYGLWMREFAGDVNVVGRPITLNGAQARAVGVLPRGF
jgi:putative ABC transport system permease protein